MSSGNIAQKIGAKFVEVVYRGENRASGPGTRGQKNAPLIFGGRST